MLRTAALVLATSGCFHLGDGDGDGPPPPTTTTECSSNGLCTSASDPLVLGAIDNPHLGVGTTLVVPFARHSTLPGFTIEPSTSGVVDATIAGDAIRIDARTAGSTVLSFRAPTGNVLKTVELAAIDIAGIEFRFRTDAVSPAALTALAGLAGSTDSVAVQYRSAAAEVLAGAGTVAVGGDGLALDTNRIALISEDLQWVSQRIDLRFAQLGDAIVTVTLADGRTKALAIQTVAAPDALAIDLLTLDQNGDVIIAPPIVKQGAYVGADAIGRMTDGRLVAGVSAAWTTNPAISAITGGGMSPELVWVMPGVAMTITAVAGNRTATAQLIGQ